MLKNSFVLVTIRRNPGRHTTGDAGLNRTKDKVLVSTWKSHVLLNWLSSAAPFEFFLTLFYRIGSRGPLGNPDKAGDQTKCRALSERQGL